MQISKKSKKKESDFPSANIGPIGGKIPSAKIGPIGGEIPTTKNVAAGEFKGVEMTALARLRSAKKNKEEAQAPRKKVEGDVSLGPTEVSEERSGYMQRLKKRAK